MRIVGFDCLKIAIELVEFVEVTEVVADTYGGVDAFDLAGSEGTTEVGLLDLADLTLGLLHVVRI